MIISRTPFRISFFGGGTDYPAWYRREGGAVLSTTIDKYCYLSCRYFPPFFPEKHLIVWSHIERVGSISEILHPVIRAGLKYLGFDDSRGLEIHYQADLPARAGIGTSSAFTVGFINAMNALRGLPVDPQRTAMQAIRLEQDILKENVGSQDQIAASYGGFNVIRFATDGTFSVEPVPISPARRSELESRLLLIYLGASRLSSEIGETVIENIPSKTETLRRMRRMVDDAGSILEGGDDLDAFGSLLHESWRLKRELSPSISSAEVDGIYDLARSHGATGGKLLGAGKTGFMVFYVPLSARRAVREALSPFLHIPFTFETQGSALVSYSTPADAILAHAQHG